QQQKVLANQGDASWYGVAAYANYAINDQWRGSLRAGYLDDTDGVDNRAEQRLKKSKNTVGYSPLKNFELPARLPYANTAADTPRFYKTAPQNPLQAPDTDNLSEFALQAVYKFSAPPPAPTT